MFLLVAGLLLPTAAAADTYSFDVHSKFVNIAFESRMEIEDIFGTTHSIKGWLKLDSKGQYQFKLQVPVESLRTGIAMRDEHLRSKMWLWAERHPDLTFEGNSVRKVGKNRYLVQGQLGLRGIKKTVKVTLTVRHIQRSAASRLGLGNEEWARLRGSFAVRLSDWPKR